MGREVLFREAAAAIVERDAAVAVAVARKALESGVEPLIVLKQGFTRNLIRVGE